MPLTRLRLLTVLTVGFMLAACGLGPTTVVQPTLPVISPTPTPAPTLIPTQPPVVIPTNPPLECGPEAAIALAQTQSDLALAADGKVEALRATSTDMAMIAQTGVAEFNLARDLMLAYDVPECLLQAKVFANQFFEERIAAYTALGTGDTTAYDSHLNSGEIARQNMVLVVNGVLGQ
jgi:hypothetical protein